jgi:hypothetical protein
MVKIEDLIVEGSYFVQGDMTVDFISRIKKLITEIMYKRGYDPRNEEHPLFQTKYFSIQYRCDIPDLNTLPMHRAKKALGLITASAFEWEKYSRGLARVKDELPFLITVSIIFYQHENRNGLKINARSEPAIVTKINTLGRKASFDTFDYSLIIERNRQFISEVMACFGAEVIEKPSTLSKSSYAPFIETLERHKFDKVAELMKKGKEKIFLGNTEDGLTDVREALVLFISELVDKTGTKSSDKISENLLTLQNQGYLDKWTHDFVDTCLRNWLYRYLSAKPVHARERVNKDDALFVYSVTENAMGFLVEKTLSR